MACPTGVKPSFCLKVLSRMGGWDDDTDQHNVQCRWLFLHTVLDELVEF